MLNISLSQEVAAEVPFVAEALEAVKARWPGVQARRRLAGRPLPVRGGTQCRRI